jgi:hypothetical protein
VTGEVALPGLAHLPSGEFAADNIPFNFFKLSHGHGQTAEHWLQELRRRADSWLRMKLPLSGPAELQARAKTYTPRYYAYSLLQ